MNASSFQLSLASSHGGGLMKFFQMSTHVGHSALHDRISNPPHFESIPTQSLVSFHGRQQISKKKKKKKRETAPYELKLRHRNCDPVSEGTSDDVRCSEPCEYYVMLSWYLISSVGEQCRSAHRGGCRVLFQLESDGRSRDMLIGAHMMTYPLTNPEICEYWPSLGAGVRRSHG